MNQTNRLMKIINFSIAIQYTFLMIGKSTKMGFNNWFESEVWNQKMGKIENWIFWMREVASEEKLKYFFSLDFQ
jgi:hypothetical protein